MNTLKKSAHLGNVVSLISLYATYLEDDPEYKQLIKDLIPKTILLVTEIADSVGFDMEGEEILNPDVKVHLEKINEMEGW